jgi:hypothetical protein
MFLCFKNIFLIPRNDLPVRRQADKNPFRLIVSPAILNQRTMK